MLVLTKQKFNKEKPNGHLFLYGVFIVSYPRVSYVVRFMSKGLESSQNSV